MSVQSYKDAVRTNCFLKPKHEFVTWCKVVCSQVSERQSLRMGPYQKVVLPCWCQSYAFIYQDTFLVVHPKPISQRFCCCLPTCAYNKSKNHPLSGLLRPLPIPSHPWSYISLDFITRKPPSEGNTVILTVIDSFSKSAHFIPLVKLLSDF